MLRMSVEAIVILGEIFTEKNVDVDSGTYMLLADSGGTCGWFTIICNIIHQL